MTESDWKVFRGVYKVALERFCERTIKEANAVASASSLSSKERYHKMYELVISRDKVLARTFDGMRRSNALIKLLNMNSLQLVTECELAKFSPEVQRQVRNC